MNKQSNQLNSNQIPQEEDIGQIELYNNLTDQPKNSEIPKKHNLQVFKKQQKPEEILPSKKQPKQNRIFNNGKTPFRLQQLPPQKNQRNPNHRIFQKRKQQTKISNDAIDPYGKYTKKEYPLYSNPYGLSQHDKQLIQNRKYKQKTFETKDERSQKSQTIISTSRPAQKILFQQQIGRNRIYNGFTLPTQKCYLQQQISQKQQNETNIDDRSQRYSAGSSKIRNRHQQIEKKYEYNNEDYINQKYSKQQSEKSQSSKYIKKDSYNQKNINYLEQKQRLYDF